MICTYELWIYKQQDVTFHSKSRWSSCNWSNTPFKLYPRMIPWMAHENWPWTGGLGRSRRGQRTCSFLDVESISSESSKSPWNSYPVDLWIMLTCCLYLWIKVIAMTSSWRHWNDGNWIGESSLDGWWSFQVGEWFFPSNRT